MKKLLIFCLLCFFLIPQSLQAITIEECVHEAMKNYPAIRKLNLLQQTEEIDQSDLTKTWLPRLSVYIQGGAQNVNVALPDALVNMMSQMGQKYDGISRWQYKAGVDLTQKVWDGGYSRSQNKIIAAESKQREASVEVDCYAIRQRVETLCFGILLSQAQCKQLDNTIAVLNANINRLQVCVNNGSALQADLDLLQVQKLTIKQQKEQAILSCSALEKMLEIFVGREISSNIVIPEITHIDTETIKRPELRLFSEVQNVNNLKSEALKCNLMPNTSLFAQSFYGYPGLNYFESMQNHKPSFNVVAGIKLQWNLDSYYAYNNNRKRLLIANQMIETDRETFELNTKTAVESQKGEIESFSKMMKSDTAIINLRESIRKTAESQLNNGVIDPTALITKINDEAQARLNAELHHIQYLQSAYKLKYTLNQ